jgi:hypothetical protein
MLIGRHMLTDDLDLVIEEKLKMSTIVVIYIVESITLSWRVQGYILFNSNTFFDF